MSEMKKTLLNENTIPPTLASPLRSQNDKHSSKMEVEKEEKKSKPFSIEFQKGVLVKLNVLNSIDDPAEFRVKLKAVMNLWQLARIPILKI